MDGIQVPGGVSDPDSLFQELQNKPLLPPPPHGPQGTEVNIDPLDALNSGQEDLFPQGQSIPLDVVPTIDELKISIEFIHGLENASLDNNDLSEWVVERLHNPYTKVFKIDDPSHLYSLKQFLATQSGPEENYTMV